MRVGSKFKVQSLPRAVVECAPNMPIECDYHMHTPLCKHAAGPMEAYVERAIELGLHEIGFSDHNPLPRGLSPNVRMAEEELDYYVNRVQELQFQYHGKIDVLLGLEMDYIEGIEAYCEKQIATYPWDYVIGSIHYLDPECRVGSWPKHFSGTTADLYTRYFELMRKLAHSGLCDIIAHLDVPKRGGYRAEECADEITKTLQEIRRANVCMEINTSGFRHPELPQPQPYPSLPIVEQALALDIPLTVNSDAHAPEQVGLEFPRIERWLIQKGCRQLARFDKRKRELYPL
jgi:histidinol-phosphatase (PHP family)